MCKRALKKLKKEEIRQGQQHIESKQQVTKLSDAVQANDIVAFRQQFGVSCRHQLLRADNKFTFITTRWRLTAAIGITSIPITKTGSFQPIKCLRYVRYGWRLPYRHQMVLLVVVDQERGNKGRWHHSEEEDENQLTNAGTSCEG